MVRSQGASRENSPNRYGPSGRERRLSGSKIPSSGGKPKGKYLVVNLKVNIWW